MGCTSQSSDGLLGLGGLPRLLPLPSPTVSDRSSEVACGFSLCMSMSLLIPIKTAVCVEDGQVRVEELEGGRRSQEVRLGHMRPPFRTSHPAPKEGLPSENNEYGIYFI